MTDILGLIDGALRDYGTSKDAMRWTPKPDEVDEHPIDSWLRATYGGVTSAEAMEASERIMADLTSEAVRGIITALPPTLPCEPGRTMLDDLRATNPPTMAVRVDGAEIVLSRSHPLFSRIDLIAERGRELVVIAGEPESPQRGPQRPPLPADCEFLAYVHVHRGVACIMNGNIETDVPVYCRDR